MKKHARTRMEVVCAWCTQPMGTKDGRGKTGITHGICRKCEKLYFGRATFWERLPWVGLQFQRRRTNQRLEQIDKDVEELDRWRDIFNRDPKLHARIIIQGKPHVHYTTFDAIFELEHRVGDEPEMKCRWN